jgi:hypothetical protein
MRGEESLLSWTSWNISTSVARGGGGRIGDHSFHVREASEHSLGQGVQLTQGVHVGSVVLGASDELPPGGRESLLGKDVPQSLCHLDHVVSGHSDLLGKYANGERVARRCRWTEGAMPGTVQAARQGSGTGEAPPEFGWGLT